MQKSKPVNIYLIENVINGKKYVGQTVKKINERFSQHKSCARTKKKKTPLYNSFIKHGFENFSIKTLIICEKEFANYYEEMCINVYESWVDMGGYNIKKPETPSNLNPAKGESHGQSVLTEKNVTDIITNFSSTPK